MLSGIRGRVLRCKSTMFCSSLHDGVCRSLLARHGSMRQCTVSKQRRLSTAHRCLSMPVCIRLSWRALSTQDRESVFDQYVSVSGSITRACTDHVLSVETMVRALWNLPMRRNARVCMVTTDLVVKRKSMPVHRVHVGMELVKTRPMIRITVHVHQATREFIAKWTSTIAIVHPACTTAHVTRRR
jgi:hypothetical protein